MTDDRDALAAIAKVINGEGGTPGSDLHSWRCEYPERYGVCDCVDETARAILDAILAAGWRAPAPKRVPCDDVHPEYGRCYRELGHEGDHCTHTYEDPRRPDGSHPWDY